MQYLATWPRLHVSAGKSSLLVLFSILVRNPATLWVSTRSNVQALSGQGSVTSDSFAAFLYILKVARQTYFSAPNPREKRPRWLPARMMLLQLAEMLAV